MTDARQKLENLTDAMVDDIMRAPEEEVLLEALTERFEKLRAQLSLALEDRAREALGLMLKHSCVADSDPNDKDEEDHAAERAARDAIGLPAPANRSSSYADALEEAAKWHDQRARDTPDVFEMELHQVSAKAIRALTPKSQAAKPVILCTCGKVLETPRDYAAHCKEFPGHFKKSEPPQ